VFVEAVRENGEHNETPAYVSYKEGEVITSIIKNKIQRITYVFDNAVVNNTHTHTHTHTHKHTNNKQSCQSFSSEYSYM
jgi:hypothetical protein